MSSVLSVDLAFRDARQLGVVHVRQVDGEVSARRHPAADALGAGRVEVLPLARHLSRLALDLGATRLMLDGPQGWRHPASDLPHARRCERLLHCPAKTGLPGWVKPATYTAFAEFSIALFEALEDLGWPRVASREHLAAAPRAVMETYPRAAWTGLGMPALPAKARATPAALADARRRLAELLPAPVPADFTHDDLQALVAATALLHRPGLACRLVGDPPARVAGHWREGFIVVPSLDGSAPAR